MTGYDQIEYGSLTDVGVRRSHNQDALAIVTARDEDHWGNQGHIFLVADGMGGHAVGELASELAVRNIPHTYLKHCHEGAGPALRKAFIEANAIIHARGQQNREFAGMGTTTTALVLRPEGAWIGHVGDSRVYRVRDAKIEQLSFDHSLLWEWAKNHRVSPESLEGSIPSNRIVRSLGPEPLVEVDIEGPHPVLPGDIFVLCSDGLSGPLSDSEIGAVASTLPPKEACQLLTDLANLRGGPDNITVVIVRLGAGRQGNGLLQPPGLGGGGRLWLQRFPWPLITLVLGVILAAVAVGLTIRFGPGWEGTLAFALAALTVVGGIGWLVAHAVREKQHPPAKPIRPRTKIYRQAPCRIEPPLLTKLAKGEANLKQRIREKHWEADWPACQMHHDLAESQMALGDLPGAFREYCRALLILTAALHRQRNKEEFFHPIWDKNGD